MKPSPAGRLGPLLTVAAMWLCAAPSGLTAQGRFGDEETRLIRQAGALESSGDLDGAEQALVRLLEIDPVSTGGIYAFERVLRKKGEVLRLLPSVDGYLRRRDDSGVRSLKLQLLVEADSVDALVEEAETWLARRPDDETPYAEVARAYEAAFGHERALEVLESGRDRLGGEALALVIGDHHAADGDIDAAVDEWARAVGETGANIPAVRRRMDGLAEGETAAAQRLVGNLSSSDQTGTRRAGIRLAIELGLGSEALDLAAREVGMLLGNDRTAYLEEVSVAATAAGVAEVASWAYSELSRRTDDPDGRRIMEQRRAEAALAAGDTLDALDAFSGVAQSLAVGSAERRMIEARTVRIAATARQMDRLRSYWAAFREAYPGAPELDALGAVTASALLGWGDLDGAIAVLEGIEGPRSSIERAYLLLGGGEIQAGQSTLMQAIPSLPPSEATDVIQMASLLGRVSGQGAQALANAAVLARVGRGGSAAQTLADQAFELPDGDRPLLLAEAARMAERAGEVSVAARIREQLVEEHPGAPEVGEASIALARHLAQVERNVPEAVRILEDLITRQPNAAVVPEARLELERLRS